MFTVPEPCLLLTSKIVLSSSCHSTCQWLHELNFMHDSIKMVDVVVYVVSSFPPKKKSKVKSYSNLPNKRTSTISEFRDKNLDQYFVSKFGTRTGGTIIRYIKSTHILESGWMIFHHFNTLLVPSPFLLVAAHEEYVLGWGPSWSEWRRRNVANFMLKHF